jgi:hypothetical protein
MAVEVVMRSWIFALAALAAALAGTHPAGAQNYPWCAVYRAGGTNCGFSTFAQCMATIAGAGGNCEENSQYSGPAKNARAAPASPNASHKEPKTKESTHEKLVAPQPQ